MPYGRVSEGERVEGPYGIVSGDEGVAGTGMEGERSGGDLDLSRSGVVLDSGSRTMSSIGVLMSKCSGIKASCGDSSP